MAFNAPTSYGTAGSFDDLPARVQSGNVGLPENPSDVDPWSECQDVLCELVRDRYLTRLRETLVRNLRDTGRNHLDGTGQRELERRVDWCVAEMERRALRLCMVASIYSRSMSNMINEVKTCTSDSTLHDSLQCIIVSNGESSSPVERFRPEDVEYLSVSSSARTDYSETSLYDMSPTESVCDLLTDDSSAVYVATSRETSPARLDPVSRPSVGGFAGFADSVADVRPAGGEDVTTRDPPEISANRPSSDFDSFSRCVRGAPGLGDGVEGDGPSPGETATAAGPTAPVRVASRNDVIRTSKVDEILKSEWKSARVAKELEFRKSTGRLPGALLTRLEHGYADLFGDGHDYEPDPLTEAEERVVCHKRAVKMVVDIMNPHYEARRISVRHFRALAKIITNKLMARSFDPDKETAEEMIKKCFMANRPIKTDEELHLITTQV